MRHRDSEKGASLVEAAFVVPIVLLLLFGMFEFGRFIVVTSTVTNASREAARYATTTGPGSGSGPRYADCAGMRDAAQEFGVLGEPTDGQITLQYDEGPATSVFLTCAGTSVDPGLLDTGDRVISTVSVPYQPIVPLISNFLGPTNISRTTTRTIFKG